MFLGQHTYSICLTRASAFLHQQYAFNTHTYTEMSDFTAETSHTNVEWGFDELLMRIFFVKANRKNYPKFSLIKILLLASVLSSFYKFFFVTFLHNLMSFLSLSLCCRTVNPPSVCVNGVRFNSLPRRFIKRPFNADDV